jgi:ABC-type sugar transport system substrate-binding protein
MRKTKWIAAVIAVIMALTFLSACGETKTSQEITTTADSKPSTTQGTESKGDLPLSGMKVGFAHITMFDEWCVGVAKAVEEQALALGAAEVNVQDANFVHEDQVKHMENFINQEYDIILLIPCDAEGIKPYVQRARDAGIPVVAMDGALEGPPLVSHVVWDQALTGKVLGEHVADYIDKNLGGEARIVCLDSKTLEWMAIRQVEFLKVLNERFGDKITIVNDSDCQTRESATNVITSINEPYDLVYAASDSNAFGAIAGLEAKGLTDIPVFSCGGFGQETYDALIKEGGQYQGVICVPAGSIVKTAYEQIIKYLNGEKDIPDIVNCEFLYVSRNSSKEDIEKTH